MTRSARPGSVGYSQPLLERAVAGIAPFFGDGTAQHTTDEAHAAALEAVLSMRPGSGKELQLAAQYWALGMAAMDCLGCAAQLTAEQVEAYLRIQQNAVRLHNLSDKSRRQLEIRQRDRQPSDPAPAEAFDEAAFREVLDRARDMVTFARASSEAARVEKDLAAAAGHQNDDVPRRQAKQAWAADLRNLAAWQQQTLH